MFSPGDLEILLSCVRQEIKHYERKRHNYLTKGVVTPPNKFRFREKRLQSIRAQLERLIAQTPPGFRPKHDL